MIWTRQFRVYNVKNVLIVSERGGCRSSTLSGEDCASAFFDVRMPESETDAPEHPDGES